MPRVATGPDHRERDAAFGQYRPAESGGGHQPWALQVLEISGGEIVGLNAFLDTTTIFPRFGLPPRLDP